MLPLPHDLLTLVLLYLPPSSYAQLSFTSRQMNNAVKSSFEKIHSRKATRIDFQQSFSLRDYLRPCTRLACLNLFSCAIDPEDFVLALTSVQYSLVTLTLEMV